MPINSALQMQQYRLRRPRKASSHSRLRWYCELSTANVALKLQLCFYRYRQNCKFFDRNVVPNYDICMISPRSAIVFFATGDSEELALDLGHRSSTLERGVEAILTNVKGLRVVNSNEFSCTASLQGPPHAIVELRDFVRTRALGAVEMDVFEKPAVRAAQSHRK
jgi:hypothetical protein